MMKHAFHIGLISVLWAMTSFAEDSPAMVCERFIAEAMAGNTNEALACGSIASESQRRSVLAQIREIEAGNVTFEIVRAFTNGPVALVALLATKTRSKRPSRCSGTWMRLVHDGGTWRTVSNLIGAPEEERNAFHQLLRQIEPFENELRKMAESRNAELREAVIMQKYIRSSKCVI